MTKNIHVVVNAEDKHWVHILQLIYANLNVWANCVSKKVSWFLKCFAKLYLESSQIYRLIFVILTLLAS